jgi:hypothetical protein
LLIQDLRARNPRPPGKESKMESRTTARSEDSVSSALADVLDLGRARLRKEAAMAAQADAEARALAKRQATLEAERAREAAARARREAAERAAEQAAAEARQEREARFQVLLASRVMAIAAKGERDLAALRQEYASRPRRRGPAAWIAVTLTALLMTMAAVGCLVGTVLGERAPADPAPSPESALLVQRSAPLQPSQPSQPSAGPSREGALASASLLLHLESNPLLPPRALPEMKAPKTWPGVKPPVTAPSDQSPRARCALLGPLGCLNE